MIGLWLLLDFGVLVLSDFVSGCFMALDFGLPGQVVCVWVVYTVVLRCVLFVICWMHPFGLWSAQILGCG